MVRGGGKETGRAPDNNAQLTLAKEERVMKD